MDVVLVRGRASRALRVVLVVLAVMVAMVVRVAARCGWWRARFVVVAARLCVVAVLRWVRLVMLGVWRVRALVVRLLRCWMLLRVRRKVRRGVCRE